MNRVLKWVKGTPHAVVIGRDGKVKWTGNPMSPKFDAAVKKQLAASSS